MTKTTLSGQLPDIPDGHGPAPGYVDPATGMHTDYWVLSEEERAKGFVRPVRTTYRHIGKQPKYPLRDLTAEEKERYKDFGYVKREDYPESESPVTGRYWTAKQLESLSCNAETRMAMAIAETYAANPKFYGATFCCQCKAHYPISEFVWLDGSVVGS